MTSKPIRIVITDVRDAQFVKSSLPETLSDVPLQWSVHQLNGADDSAVVSACLEADVVVVDLVDMHSGIIERLKQTRLIIRHGAGYDNVDVPTATKRGILVSVFPDYCTEEVAEHTAALILAVNRKLALLNRAVQRKEWDHASAVPICQLRGKTLGLIGCGRIGSRVLDRMRGFEMKYIVYDPYIPKTRETDLGMQLIDLDTTIAQSDVLSIHAPLTEETRHMVGRRQFASMKREAFLINTARGAIVDTAALVDALKVKRIAGAALDVVEDEPPFHRDDWCELDNLFITPHAAWYSEESVRSINRKMIDEIRRFVGGQPLKYGVNPTSKAVIP